MSDKNRAVSIQFVTHRKDLRNNFAIGREDLIAYVSFLLSMAIVDASLNCWSLILREGQPMGVWAYCRHLPRCPYRFPAIYLFAGAQLLELLVRYRFGNVLELSSLMDLSN